MILYAYCKKSREILAVTLGKRSIKTVRELYLNHWIAIRLVMYHRNFRLSIKSTQPKKGEKYMKTYFM
jgi:hypothetical protein